MKSRALGILTTVCFLMTLLGSCSDDKSKKKLTLQEIEKEFPSGVVLIQNRFVYELEFENGLTFYYTLDDNNDINQIEFEPSEITPVVSYGTGFFVSQDGKIATNAHVAAPDAQTAHAKSEILGLINTLIAEGNKKINEYNDNISNVNAAYWSTSDRDIERQLQQMSRELQSDRDELQEKIDQLRTLSNMQCISSTLCEIGIAYNDTHITNLSDFIPCVLLKSDPEHDLAIIQLKDKTTPKGKHVYAVNNKAKNKKDDNDKGKVKDTELKVGQKVYMIGYNLGPQFAITEEGLKCQVNSGDISQSTDKTRVMYSIPALHGSSGSPVIDVMGNLVAINYAGYDKSQSFNFGIRVKHLIELLKSVN